MYQPVHDKLLQNPSAIASYCIQSTWKKTASLVIFASMILAPGTYDDVAPLQGHLVNGFSKHVELHLSWADKDFEFTQSSTIGQNLKTAA